eukprot:scaffold4073_cov68-Cylindrotheca_fusiformis.AAC.3
MSNSSVLSVAIITTKQQPLYFLGSFAFLIPASRARFGAKKGKLSNKPPPNAAPTILPPSPPAFLGTSFTAETVSPTSRSYVLAAKAGAAVVARVTAVTEVVATLERNALLSDCVAAGANAVVVEATRDAKRMGAEIFIMLSSGKVGTYDRNLEVEKSTVGGRQSNDDFLYCELCVSQKKK